MLRTVIPMRALILVVYLLGTVFSALPLVGRAEQSAASHAQMMAMAGHAGTMATMDDSQSDDAQKLLCEQHCRVATATLPLAEQPVRQQVHAAPVLPGPEPRAASLVLPPPGPPPKVALI